MGLISYPIKIYQQFREASAKNSLELREILRILVPNRWKQEKMWEDIGRKYGRKRLLLPQLTVEEVFPGFNDIPIMLNKLPLGDWSTSLIDQIVLTKLARLLSPKTILEVGSFRGYTARLLAENTPPETIIHTVDINPNHGEAYRNTPLETRIKRHVGSLHSSALDLLKNEKFDLIFLDADHRKEAVEADTQVLLPMLAENGLLLWHDYADWGWISGYNGVPEVLAQFSQTIPIFGIPNTALAIHCQSWTHKTLNANTVATVVDDSRWTTQNLR